VDSFLQVVSHLRKRIDPLSLQFRLTAGITAVSVLGLGSLAALTSWQMYQILVNSHRRGVTNIVERLPRDVTLYSEMVPVEVGLKKAINNLTAPNLFIWVERSDGTVLAQSETLKGDPIDILAQPMAGLEMPSQPPVVTINGRYLVLSSSPLKVRGKILGQLNVAQDITSDQVQMIAMVRNLGIICISVIIAITVVIALYVERSLQSLRQMSQMARAISADDLGQVQMHLEHSPSEVKELAHTFNTMLLRLSEAWEQQRQFVGNVSHELRTPLTIVHGYLQSTLRRSANLTESQREALEIASSEANRTIRLLQDLLELARADSGTMHFHLEPLMLNDLVVEVVGMAKRFSGREVLIEAAPLPVAVRADENRLKRVLLNLIDNALKYSDPGQPVTVKFNQAGEEVIIQVSDRGRGIPLQQQTRIFERFYRVDEARARVRISNQDISGGYGLGLPIVKTLVEGMGGRIAVRSKVGEGSIFTVTLPAQPPNP